MQTKVRSHDPVVGMSWNPATATLATMLTLLFFTLITLMTQSVQAQTFQVLYTFGGGPDGAYPASGLTIDQAGNFYGTTAAGGYTGGPCSGWPYYAGCGTVFKLSRKGSSWTLTTLYSFTGNEDGGMPLGPVTIAPDGSLYGTTGVGGDLGCSAGHDGCGTIFKLSAPTSLNEIDFSPWTKTTLLQFDGTHGAGPEGNLVLDQQGNIYSTAAFGGPSDDGCAFQLVPSGDGWTENILHSFKSSPFDGATPQAGLIADQSGNFYGMTLWGGAGGIVYEITQSGSGWDYRILHHFMGIAGGFEPEAGLIMDGSGNLYGTTSVGGPGSVGGTVFMLSPSNGGWTFHPVYNFLWPGPVGPIFNPWSTLAMDAHGNLYGTTLNSWGGSGGVFELMPSGEGGWQESTLYIFSGSDGSDLFSGVTLDANGNLYGVTYEGGGNGCGGSGCGVIYEITP